MIVTHFLGFDGVRGGIAGMVGAPKAPVIPGNGSTGKSFVSYKLPELVQRAKEEILEPLVRLIRTNPTIGYVFEDWRETKGCFHTEGEKE